MMVLMMMMMMMIAAVIITLGHRNWKVDLFLLLMGKQHSREAYSGQSGILADMLWFIARKPEGMDWNSQNECQASSPFWKALWS